jgi:uncharacterized membrane protein YciS (DUF1049 family)
MNIIRGIIIGIIIMVFISAIRPSKEQGVLTYNSHSEYTLSTNITLYFKKGYRVSSMLSYESDYGHHKVIIILEK